MTSRGFTLVEIAIALVIIGAILGVIASQTGLIGAGNAIHVTAIAQDLAKASAEFRIRHKFLPGDFPATTADLAGVACAGNGNGVVDDATESSCAADHLLRASLVRSSLLQSKYGPVRLISRAGGIVAGHPAAVLNVIELCLIPQDVASDVDARMDDGNLATGSVLWASSSANAWCSSGILSVALR